MLSTANELKYLREIHRILGEQIENPSHDFVRFFYAQINPHGRFTTSAREQFTEFVKKAFQQFVRERVSSRLRNALEQEAVSVGPLEDVETEVEVQEAEEDGVETTEEELEGYHIVKAIVRQVVAPERVVHRDTKSYMGILLDDNNRRPICRLRFNHSQKYIGLFDEGKVESKQVLGKLDDIYKYAEQLKKAAQQYG